MKRNILFISLLVLFSACENTIDYDFGGVEPQLVVAGIMDASEEEHVVFMSISQHGSVLPVNNGTVKCYVNGELKAEESLKFSELGKNKYLMDVYSDRPWGGDWWEYDNNNQLPLAFSAKFNPGDEVKLEFEANGGKFKASSMDLSVPVPVSFSRIDTLRVTTGNWEGMEYENMRIDADLPDIKEEKNWYCLETLKQTKGVYKFQDGGPDVTIILKDVMNMTDMDDLVLLDGNAPDNDIFSFSSAGNGDFAVFSDGLFSNGTAHLKMNFSSWDFDYREIDDYTFSEYLSSEDNHRGARSLTKTQTVDIFLSNCSEATYFYMKALRAMTSPNYMPQIMEPVTVPSNIKDGVGFVDIVNTTVKSFELAGQSDEYVPEL